MKRIIPLSVIAAAAIALTGCAGGGGTSSGSLLIGGIAGTTGAYGSTGQAVVNGTQLAVAEINKAGGINGQQVKFDWADDGADATTSSQLFNKYLSAGAVAIVGSPDTGPTTAALADQKKFPVLGAVDDGGLTIYPDGPDKPPYAYAFSTSLNTFAWGGAIAEYALANCTGGLAVLHDPSSYGLGGLAGITTVYDAAGKKLALEESITENWSTGATVGLKAEIEKIVASGADCVDIWLTPQDQASFVQEANSLGVDLTFLGNDETDADATFSDLAGDQAVGMISALLTTDVNPTDKLTAFRDAYKKKFAVEATPFAELSYDAVYILKKAIETGKSTKPADIKDQLNKITAFEGLTGSLTFSETQHTTINKEQLTMVSFDGASKTWKPLP
jgi:ABC-type branched-subunit amino acid transport system substrate-binding protein